MGIYDRDYSRNEGMAFGSGRGVSGPRTWSVNTWLIVACVVVFVLNLMLPPALIQSGEIVFASEEAAQ